MNSRTLAILGSIFALLLLLVMTYLVFAYRSEKALLDKMSLLQPGMKLELVRAQLGTGSQEFSNLDEVVSHGSVKDRNFCAGKKLHWFPSGPPWSVLEVYTNPNDEIVYVTWQSL